jgi:hypothetical protein
VGWLGPEHRGVDRLPGGDQHLHVQGSHSRDDGAQQVHGGVEHRAHRQPGALSGQPGGELIRLAQEQVRPHVVGEGEQVGHDRRRQLCEHAKLASTAGHAEAGQERIGVRLMP